MFRLMLMMGAFLWSAVLDAGSGAGGGEGGAGGSGEGGGTGGGGAGGSGATGDSFTLSEAELTQRTTAAAEAKQKEIAELLGIDVDKIADAKGLIEAGRKAGQAPAADKPGDESGNEEGKTIEDKLAAILKPITDRLEGIEQTEQTRQQQQAEETRSEKLSAALKEAGVRDERMDHVRRYAGTFDVKVNDKGELEGTQAAIDAAKQAFPDAFRGEGDTGQAADATNREGKPRPKNLVEALTAHYQKG